MRRFRWIDGSARKTDRNFYYTGENRCEGCGLLHGDGGRVRAHEDDEGELTEPTVRFRPEVGRVTCSDCSSPVGYAASMNMLVEPDPLRILASLDYIPPPT